jgi:hypothetical protein
MQARLSVEEAEGRIVSIDAELILDADLDPERRAQLLEAAGTCRISRALAVPVTLRASDTPPALGAAAPAPP